MVVSDQGARTFRFEYWKTGAPKWGVPAKKIGEEREIYERSGHSCIPESHTRDEAVTL